VLVGLGAGAGPARRLASLFVRARYSSSEMTAADRDDARAALDSIVSTMEPAT
jgi:Domain of unknown function (DUF4129)